MRRVRPGHYWEPPFPAKPSPCVIILSCLCLNSRPSLDCLGSLLCISVPSLPVKPSHCFGNSYKHKAFSFFFCSVNLASRGCRNSRGDPRAHKNPAPCQQDKLTLRPTRFWAGIRVQGPRVGPSAVGQIFFLLLWRQGGRLVQISVILLPVTIAPDFSLRLDKQIHCLLETTRRV